MKDSQAAIKTASPEFSIGRVSRFTPKEELANAASHFLGAGFSLVALFYLIFYSIRTANPNLIVGSSIFGLTMLAMYFSSAMTHALPLGRVKNVFYNLDQVTIYLLIAGTYTPIALSLIGDGAWLMLAIEWTLALSGVVLKLLMPGNFERGTNIIIIVSYVIMGWLVLPFMGPILRNLDLAFLKLILIGGAFYTFGIFFFKAENIKFAHLIWHLMVLAGSVMHFWAIIKYILN